jgi:tRNA threonylcarbamoyl adenosine modification protein (Sua5/YciO/YrdC/YwlC family)
MHAQLLTIHPENPQDRLIKQVADGLREGEIAVVPTDSGYALACCLENKAGVERIRQIRRLEKDHNFTLLCRDFSQLSNFAKVGNAAFRMGKKLLPGPYTFIYKATKEVPSRLMHEKRKTIGLRVPNNKIIAALLAELGEPLMSVSLILTPEEGVMTEAYEIYEMLQNQVDWVIDGGFCGFEPTTVIDWSEDEAVLIRQGQGSVEGILE